MLIAFGASVLLHNTLEHSVHLNNTFRQLYIPSTPSKYGIKIHLLCDAKTFYM